MFLHPLDVARQLKAMPHLAEVREEAGHMQAARKRGRLKGGESGRTTERRKESGMKERAGRESAAWRPGTGRAACFQVTGRSP